MEMATTPSFKSIFGTQTAQTPKQSFEFICKLTSIGISSIVYLRSHLPEECFTLKKIDGVRVTQLVPDSGECVSNICRNARIAMKALKCGYLSKLEILIFPHAHAEEAIESYIFEYDYTPSEFSTGDAKESGEDLRRAANSLIRKLGQHWQLLNVLPESAHLGMIMYYTDDAPEDFCPPGFVSMPLNFRPNFINGQVPALINTGSVSTRFHRIQTAFQSQLYEGKDSQSQKSPSFGSKNSQVPIVASLNVGLDMCNLK